MHVLGAGAIASVLGDSGQMIVHILDVLVMDGDLLVVPDEHIAGVKEHVRRPVQVPVSSLSQGRS